MISLRINELHIKNFLTFEELEISDLKRVNLIAGSNNSGKTALLEAIRILESQGDDTVINNILQNRGSYISGHNDIYENLFNRNAIKASKGGMFSQAKIIKIEINSLEIIRSSNYLPSIEYSLKYNTDQFKKIQSVASPNHPNDKAIYIPYQFSFEKLEELWSNIVLTPKEDDVLKIIQDSIDSSIIRFDISRQKVKVRLSNTEQPVPLDTMGDGVQRILLIALGLANAQSKVLLIDEIEMGLHHTVLEKLWKIIFKYSKLWNIQVFVTTHSQDAIRTFYYVSSEKEYENESAFIRIQKGRTGKSEAIIFDKERLENSIKMELEIR